MTSPSHHLSDELLLLYASGTATAALDLFCAAHLALCPRCREAAAVHEAAGGALLETLDHAPVSDDLLQGVLDRLDDPAPEPPAPEVAPGEVLPRPLRDLTGPASEVAWSWLVPGIRQVELPLRHEGRPLRLFELAPGLKIPAHTHEGEERTLVLQGGFTDRQGHYVRGDVSLRDGSADHHQVIDEGPPCLALVVADAPLVPRSILAWLLTLFVDV